MTRIVIADDSPGIRGVLRSLLEKHRGWEICGEASNGLEAVSQAAELNPDLVILDLTMPNLNGFQAARAIHIAAAKLPLLLLTQHEIDARVEREARASGFSGAVNKGSNDLLIAGIESILRGEAFFSSTPTPGFDTPPDQPRGAAESKNSKEEPGEAAKSVGS
jgi:two-component system, NarL family, response regulator NreC